MIGLLMIGCALAAALVSDRWAGRLAFLTLLGATAAYWLAPQAAPLSGDFFGFRFVLSLYRPATRFTGMGLAGFGAISMLYVAPKRLRRWFYVGSLIHVGASLTLLSVGDLLSFFVFWELITLGAVALLYQDEVDFAVLKRYFVYQMAGATALLIGVAVNFAASGSIALADISAGRGFFLFAVAIKTAVIPLHLWLTRTYPAISKETTVVLSAYATKIGVIGASLLLPGYGLELFGATAALVAVLYALKQSGLREFLSFHIISQVGYMTAGVSSTVALAVSGGYYHLVSHVLYKGLLFMVAGVLVDSFGESDMYRIRGAGRLKPFLTVAAVVASASIAGIPPFNGFISKSLLKSALAGSAAAWLLIAAGVGTALSFTKFLYLCFFKRGGTEIGTAPQRVPFDAAVPIPRTPLSQQLAMLLLVFGCVLMGIAPRPALTRFFATEHAFYYVAGIWSGTWPALLALALFALAFEKISRLLKFALPDSLGVLSGAARFSEAAITQLRMVHNGHILRYLSWAVGGLVLVWAVLLLF